MHSMKIYLVVALLVLIPLLTYCGEDQEAAAFVSRFYTTLIKHGSPGLPEGDALAPLVPFFSQRLNNLILSALAYQNEFIANHPGDKPPFVDGCFFTSSFEGPGESFKIVKVARHNENTWGVTVHFVYDPKDKGWDDTVVVIMEKGHLVIDDINYGGAGDFNPPGRLSRTLAWRE